MSAAQLDVWLEDLTTKGDVMQGYEPCLAAHPKRRLLCDLPVEHDGGHACFPSHYKEPVFWRRLDNER